MKSSRNKKQSKHKKSMAPFIAGAAIGTAAGFLLAKKPGEELREDLGDNFETIKEKAKDVYENKEEIIDNLERSIKKFTKSEIKNFVEPEYYSKEFDIDDFEFGPDDEIEISEEIIKPIYQEEVKETVNNVTKEIKESSKEITEEIKESAKEITEEVKETTGNVKDTAKEAADKIENIAEHAKDTTKKAADHVEEEIAKKIKSDKNKK